MQKTVALIQMDIAYGQPEANRKKVEEKIAQAMEQQPDLIMLPELWDTGYDLTRLDEIADDHGQTNKSFLQGLARKHQVSVIGGSVSNREETGTYNTLYAFDPSGKQTAEYKKVHLFRLMEEEKYLKAGNQEGVFQWDGLLCAAAICYDIRFPEWIRKMMLRGAHVLFVPAEWPEPRLSHWRHLLISRAVENQCYVVACNRAGKDPKNTFAGHSMVVDPWGEVIAEAGEDEEILFADLDLSLVQKVRSTIPVFTDRRPELYE
ncbi:carbon-nitrogen family hydrolase [Thermoactinomyces intermedius]|uniref:Carbon-nitrogen family hydrolase n=1 Tax=Thermoactinomyces intermedius TaxID=2024 RepID=A0A8I1DB35_THEIN|nr:carbon-nitrogen family hydrolase [Thermoactinomyces intermedius]MBA4547803.1 carbon-nitrogen family hydrolase [Thermoactinomyces intermedius]MBA4836586.1 carbon-nitrogen family hydrolase [Thermoactinomyces intermedius]MBH8593968.1 carbon-nitrogen family hydrolase [Thermoactinomyces intermedius]